MSSKASLLSIIKESGVTVVPGVYDVVTASLVKKAGFRCCYMTGAGVSMSATGFPDIGLISLAEVLQRLERIAGSLDMPLIADGDTGFGGPLHVVRTVREFERAGAAAIQLEDQKDPKRCGHELGRQCIPVDEMMTKITAALDSRNSQDFLIIARTDARTTYGLDDAIERAVAYEEAGADAIFLESLESVEEMRKARAAVEVPMLANMVEGGRTPLLTTEELTDIGYEVALYPNTILRSLCKGVSDVLSHLAAEGDTTKILKKMWTHRQVWDLFDYEEWVTLEARYVDRTATR